MADTSFRRRSHDIANFFFKLSGFEQSFTLNKNEFAWGGGGGMLVYRFGITNRPPNYRSTVLWQMAHSSYEIRRWNEMKDLRYKDMESW